jgi:Ribbon-helix-helix protein, copG family
VEWIAAEFVRVAGNLLIFRAAGRNAPISTAYSNLPLGVSPRWCNVVKIGSSGKWKAKMKDRREVKGQSPSAIRASISFPAEVYETLETIAKEKKVSLAWVVRDAAEHYIGEKWPLFNRKVGAQQ